MDVLLAVDLVRLAAKRAFDTAILVAADRDFVPAVEAVLENGPRVEVVTVGEKQDWLPLARRADRWVHVSMHELLPCVRRERKAASESSSTRPSASPPEGLR